MTDMYIIKRRGSRKGCLRALVVLAALCMLAVAVVLVFKRPRRLAQPAAAGGTPAEQAAAEPETAPPQRDAGARLLADARQARDTGDLLKARELCHAVLDQSTNADARAAAEETLGQVNTELVFSPRPMPEKQEYTVEQGDTLGSLASKFNTTVELIAKGNNVSGALIRVGDRYRILSGTFSVAVDKSDNTLVVLLNDRFFKRYRVGTGKFQKTPAGTFTITDRITQPTWWRPDGKAIPFGDPENVLGTHWLSLSIRGYGIHGTWEPDTIGKQASEGCIRLLNEDVAELYGLLPVGTPVVISE